MKKSIMWVTAAPLFMNVCEIIVERFIWVNTGFGSLLRKHSHLLTSLKTQSNPSITKWFRQGRTPLPENDRGMFSAQGYSPSAAAPSPGSKERGGRSAPAPACSVCVSETTCIGMTQLLVRNRIPGPALSLLSSVCRGVWESGRLHEFSGDPEDSQSWRGTHYQWSWRGTWGSQAKFRALSPGAALLRFLERNFIGKIGKLAQSASTPEAY